MIISLISPLRAGALVFFLLMSGGALAHEGHDHADEKVVTAPATLKPRLVARSGPFELVALREDGELLIFLDRFDTNEPVTAAQVTVETPEGSKEANLKDGVYRLPAPWEQNALDLIFTVVEGPTTEVLAGTLNREAPSPPNAPTGWNLWTPAFAQGLSEKIGSGIPWLLLLFAFAIGVGLGRFLSVPGKSALGLFLAALLVSTPHSTQAHEAGEHEPAKLAMPLSSEMAQRLSDGALFVPKSVQRLLAIRTMVTAASVHHKTLELPGRVIPDPNASGFVQASVSGRISAPQGGFPRLGTSVKAGDVLALVTPPFQAIDVSDMRQKQGELDQQIGIVEKRLARYESLAKTGAVPRVQLDEAILELRGLRDRRSALDKVRAEPEKLIAPVSGVVASTNAAAGKIAEPNSVVFQIIDPARLWVEALTFSLIPSAQSATARTADGGTLTLMFQGAGLTDRSQAIPVQFAIEHAPEGLRVGQLVTVLATTGEEIKGLAIPRASVLRTTNGQTIVFDHAGAERFEPRMVRIEPLDAERVVVLSGLGAGARVVVQGAELLNQIR
ncbi:MAG TPA: HlyD family efflux transporter periplasmic adaptor subunit [Hyphomicrobiaceae bacterium]|nr:HlyD family efflux transporter periplasmic adaptor subunit [Hyphomicrobiaceae bacterium]